MISEIPAVPIHLPGVAGVDEAGRGPLAGPVVAAAVVLPSYCDRTGIADSKKLDPERREALADRIRQDAYWSIAVVDAHEIDRLNILNATLFAMARALEGLNRKPERAIVDGNRIPPDLDLPCEAAVKGDAIYACVAAASILAKTERDRILRAYARLYPEYGFDRHFGYGTPEHLEAIALHGPCPIHRRSFHPIRQDNQLCLTFDV
jgi:ribonuclease HII